MGGVALLLTQWHVTPGLQGCQRVASLLAPSLGYYRLAQRGYRRGGMTTSRGNPFPRSWSGLQMPLAWCNAVVSPSATSALST